MEIKGLAKTTLLDYPGHVAATLFVGNCQFKCPFCHNGSLVTKASQLPNIPLEEVYAFLEKRRGVLDGVCVTGGEPTFQPDLRELLYDIKSMGYLVKLDTNGSFPQRLEDLLRAGLLDYIAMDLKHSPEGYSRAAGIDAAPLLPRIERSVSLLMHGKTPYEFRTTLVKGLHTPGDVERIAGWIAGDSPYFLQSYADSGDILSPGGLDAFSEGELQQMLQLARKHCPKAALRGI